ncbi:uncharacterized protein EDB93DRAFT_1103340, partial [Suillus bovinus]|uniref:uncharacterized protein n=1 Tax=Suillus bovinus TaxID=48563 RepID=UPI001B86DD6B
KTVTAAKEPTPAPAPVPSSTSRVPRSALDVPMPDLHAMAMAIQEGAARIAALEERVVEQDAKIDTLQCLHEGLRREIILWHPTFPLLDSQGDATSFLLHQPVPPAVSTPASALFPEYDSVEEMDVQVKGEPSGEDVDMTT